MKPLFQWRRVYVLFSGPDYKIYFLLWVEVKQFQKNNDLTILKLSLHKIKSLSQGCKE